MGVSLLRAVAPHRKYGGGRAEPLGDSMQEPGWRSRRETPDVTDLDREGGTFVVGTISVVLAVATIWYLTAYDVISDEAPLSLGAEVIEATNIVVIVAFVLALGSGSVWLARMDLPEGGKWRAGIWSAAGFVGSVIIVVFLQVHWLLDGVAPPTQSLVEHYLIAVSAGSIGGLLVGVNAARLRQHRRQVEHQRDAFAVLNEFLRHHVLNGMQVVVGYTDLLRETDHDDDLPLDEVDERTQDIVDLVTRVNVVGRSIARETDLAPVALRPVIESELAALREEHPGTQVTLDVPADVTVLADQLLGAVVGNVLRNAVDHNAGDVSIWATATVTDETVTLTVADDGVGIPDERKPAVFEPGEPGPRKVGRGLGLYLVSVLVERYGGQVDVADAAQGGAAVVLELPRAWRDSNPRPRS